MEKLIEFRGGKGVFRDTRGRLFVGGWDCEGELREVDPAQPFGVLPVLEVRAAALPEDIRAVLPMNEVLTLALGWESGDYWPRLAVEWIDRTSVSDEVKAALAELVHSRRGSQRTRHAARRLLKEGE